MLLSAYLWPQRPDQEKLLLTTDIHKCGTAVQTDMQNFLDYNIFSYCKIKMKQ